MSPVPWIPASLGELHRSARPLPFPVPKSVRKLPASMAREHAWLLFACFDAALIASAGWWLDLPILYALAPLSFPVWTWVGGLPQGQALLDRLWRRR